MTDAESPLDASPFRVAIVVGRFHPQVTQKLLEGAIACLEKHGAHDVSTIEVPGAFELPLGARAAIEDGADAVVALGCVIRGETAHFDFVAAEAARGIMEVGLTTGIPVAFGVLTTDTEAQALARAGGERGNKGWDAAETAIEMAMLLGKGPGE